MSTALTEKSILEYTKDKYPNEHELIGRSMVNYYDLRLREDKSETDEFHQEKILSGVLDLFEVLSHQIAIELDEEPEVIFNLLRDIHIKT